MNKERPTGLLTGQYALLQRCENIRESRCGSLDSSQGRIPQLRALGKFKIRVNICYKISSFFFLLFNIFNGSDAEHILPEIDTAFKIILEEALCQITNHIAIHCVRGSPHRGS